MPQSPARSAPRRTPGRPTARARGRSPAATTPARDSAPGLASTATPARPGGGALGVASPAKSPNAKRTAKKPKAVKRALKTLYPNLSSAAYPKRVASQPPTVKYWHDLWEGNADFKGHFAGGKELYEAVRDRVAWLRREAAKAEAKAGARASPSRARGRPGMATRSLTRPASRSPVGPAPKSKRAKANRRSQPQRALDFAQAPAPAAPGIPEEEITGLLAEVGALAGEVQGGGAAAGSAVVEGGGGEGGGVTEQLAILEARLERAIAGGGGGKAGELRAALVQCGELLAQALGTLTPQPLAEVRAPPVSQITRQSNYRGLPRANKLVIPKTNKGRRQSFSKRSKSLHVMGQIACRKGGG